MVENGVSRFSSWFISSMINIPRKNIGIKKLPSEIFLVSISFFKRGFIYWYQFSCDNVTSKKHCFCFIIRRLTLEAPTTENGHTQAIRWLLRTNSLSVFDHFVVSTLKVLTLNLSKHIVSNNLSTMLENYYLNWRRWYRFSDVLPRQHFFCKMYPNKLSFTASWFACPFPENNEKAKSRNI